MNNVERMKAQDKAFLDRYDSELTPEIFEFLKINLAQSILGMPYETRKNELKRLTEFMLNMVHESVDKGDYVVNDDLMPERF